LQSISLSKYAFSIRVPKVFALVVDDYGVIGILEEFIPSEYTLGKILGHAVAPDSERRNKWAQQVKQTVYQLHEIGVVWGDGKPENILIDYETDDAWLIDFGGSFTDGWVDVELKETLDGDEQALRKTTQALDIGDENVESDRVIEDGVAEGLNEKVSMADANARPEPSHARLPFALDYS
jgi:tRNA A-37 threonylcarbamoyl transferase component Bud32